MHHKWLQMNGNHCTLSVGLRRRILSSLAYHWRASSSSWTRPHAPPSSWQGPSRRRSRRTSQSAPRGSPTRCSWYAPSITIRLGAMDGRIIQLWNSWFRPIYGLTSLYLWLIRSIFGLLGRAGGRRLTSVTTWVEMMNFVLKRESLYQKREIVDQKRGSLYQKRWILQIMEHTAVPMADMVRFQ